MNEQLMEREEFLALATPLVADYERSPNVDAVLNTIEAVTLTGGAGVGKDYIRGEVGYEKIIGFATRNIRKGEVNGIDYRFIGVGDEIKFNNLLELIKKREVVQLAIGSDNKNLYGSFLDDWQKHTDQRCSFDVVLKTAREFRSMPFKALHNFFVVHDDYDVWQQQWDLRGDGTDSQDHEARMLETHDSLQSGLEDDEFYFIVNDGITNQAVDTVRTIVEQRIHDAEYERYARKVGRIMLSRIDQSLQTV